VISALKLKAGEVIADIGAGSGYFTFRLARHVGDTGRVYAVDVSPDMVTVHGLRPERRGFERAVRRNQEARTGLSPR
jgi:ubiquinone/menaquinone biosynthesis C-methylase UbiE